MEVKIRKSSTKRISYSTKQRLKELSFGIDGMMSSWLEYSQEFPIWIAKQDGEIVGWACITGKNPKCRTTVGVYVSYKHRRQGIGTQLVKQMGKQFPYLSVDQNTCHGKPFYASLGAKRTGAYLSKLDL